MTHCRGRWYHQTLSLGVLVGMLASGCTTGLPHTTQYTQGQPGMGYGQYPGYPTPQDTNYAQAGRMPNQGMPNQGMHQVMRPPMPGMGGQLQQVSYQPNMATLPQPQSIEAMPNGAPRPLPVAGQPGSLMMPSGQGMPPGQMMQSGPGMPLGPTVGPMPPQGPGTLPLGPVVSGGPGGPVGAMMAGPVVGPGMPMDGPPPLPRELAKSVMPPYTLEPPDTIYIDVVRAIPKPPYRVEPLDVLVVNVAETLPNQPINGTFLVSPDGLINLGYAYGVVRVAGLTLEQSAAAIKLILRSKLNDPQVGVGLAQFRGTATLKGEFMLAQDGTVTLGTYGCVQLAGLTVNQAKAMIENHLSKWLMNPEVSVTVTGYNSKVYYIITDGAGFGQQVYRFPITGNETVLDALAQANGLSAVSSKRRIWLARPAPACKGCYQILPIHWEVITQAGATETNWQLFPGDRIFIGADPWIEWDNKIAKIFAPIERMLGITLLGTATVNTFRGFNNGNGGGTTFIPVGGF